MNKLNSVLEDNNSTQVVEAPQPNRGSERRNSALQGKMINFQYKAILKSRYSSKGRPLTSSMHDAHIALDFAAQNQPQAAQID